MLFVELARAAGDLELLSAISNVCERVAALHSLEEQFIPELGEELDTFRGLIARTETAALRSQIAAYQRRRDRAVPQMVAALQRTF